MHACMRTYRYRNLDAVLKRWLGMFLYGRWELPTPLAPALVSVDCQWGAAHRWHQQNTGTAPGKHARARATAERK